MKNLTFTFFILLLFSSAQAAINQIRWGSTANPLNGLTISWTNTGSNDSIQWGYTSIFEKGKFAGIKRNGYSSGKYFFSYPFPSPAVPNSTIYYKLYDSGTKAWGTQKTFSTAPASDSKTFNFLAIGDSRNGLAVWKKISGLANSKNAALTVFNGDIVANGESASEWDGWFSNGAAYLENNLVYHAQGNHDEDATGKYFQNVFELPKNPAGNELYYSVKYGNALFISIDTQQPSNSAQLTWLENTLKTANADSTIFWKVVSFHKPHFNIGSHAGEMNSYRKTIWKKFDDYGVDLVLNGHDHNYQRTKPVNLNVSASSPVSKYGSQPGEGRCQIICGGAGAPLYSVSSSANDVWAMQQYQSVDNFVLCEVNECKMTITAFKTDGSILDSFVLDKTSNPACTTTDTPEKVQIFNSIGTSPNPANGIFTLNYLSKDRGKGTVVIQDLFGKQVYSEAIEKTENKFSKPFNVSTFPAGIYNLQIVVNEQADNTLIILK